MAAFGIRNTPFKIEVAECIRLICGFCHRKRKFKTLTGTGFRLLFYIIQLVMLVRPTLTTLMRRESEPLRENHQDGEHDHLQDDEGHDAIVDIRGPHLGWRYTLEVEQAEPERWRQE